MGSRYGGLKQLDGVGPSGETIMDYSVFDAARAGFGKVVFVIGRHFERDFREKVLAKYEGRIPTEVVFQSVDALPDGFVPPADRVKPWGTGHAVLTAAGTVREPFAVINADDFYGRNGFEVLARFLAGTDGTGRCRAAYVKPIRTDSLPRSRNAPKYAVRRAAASSSATNRTNTMRWLPKHRSP